MAQALLQAVAAGVSLLPVALIFPGLVLLLGDGGSSRELVEMRKSFYGRSSNSMYPLPLHSVNQSTIRLKAGDRYASSPAFVGRRIVIN